MFCVSGNYAYLVMVVCVFVALSLWPESHYTYSSKLKMLAWCLHISGGSNLSLKSQDTFTLAAKSPDEKRAWIQVLRQVLYRDAGGGKMCWLTWYKMEKLNAPPRRHCKSSRNP